MTDYPPDLIDTLTANFPWIEDITIEAILDALASWCDGDLFDPTTGQRVMQAYNGEWIVTRKDHT